MSPYSVQSTPGRDDAGKQEEANDEAFLEGFRSMSLDDTQHARFLGRSSHFPLMKAAYKMKCELIAEANPQMTGRKDVVMAMTHRRRQFWVHVFVRTCSSVRRQA